MISSTAYSPHDLVTISSANWEKSLHFNWKFWYWELTHTHPSLKLVSLFQSGSYIPVVLNIYSLYQVFQTSGDDRLFFLFYRRPPAFSIVTEQVINRPCSIYQYYNKLRGFQDKLPYFCWCFLCIQVSFGNWKTKETWKICKLGYAWPTSIFVEITWLLRGLLKNYSHYQAFSFDSFLSFQYGCPNSDAQP